MFSAKSPQLCPAVYDLVDCSPPGSSLHGVLQARILEWVPMPPPGDLSDPGIKAESLLSAALAGRFFVTYYICHYLHYTNQFLLISQDSGKGKDHVIRNIVLYSHFITL